MVRILLVTVMVLAFLTQSQAATMKLDGKEIKVPVCGGFAGIPCEKDEWCDFPDHIACGLGDHFGVCRPRPQICNERYNPVCGCDGDTYANSCKAAMAGVDAAHAGVCRSKPK